MFVLIFLSCSWRLLFQMTVALSFLMYTALCSNSTLKNHINLSCILTWVCLINYVSCSMPSHYTFKNDVWGVICILVMFSSPTYIINTSLLKSKRQHWLWMFCLHGSNIIWMTKLGWQGGEKKGIRQGAMSWAGVNRQITGKWMEAKAWSRSATFNKMNLINRRRRVN